MLPEIDWNVASTIAFGVMTGIGLISLVSVERKGGNSEVY